MFEKLDKRLQKIIKEKGWLEATIAQKRSFDSILNGEDTLLIAPTGIGKTESACLPIFSKWLENRPKKISFLYITPLKALNRDQFSRQIWWANKIGMEVGVRHGDTTQYERSKQLAFPPDMLITTPESLQALLVGKKMRENLRNVKWVIVDEVHEIISSKRGTQLSVGLERLRRLAGDFQTIGLSATIGTPEKVSKFLGGANIIKAVADKDYDIEVVSPKETPEDIQLAAKLYTGADTASRLRFIHDNIDSHKSTLLFTNTRQASEVLSSRMDKMEKVWKHRIHHSSLSKDVRIEAEESFRSEETKAIIATSSLELGIDIGSIDLVMQYMSPRQASKLIQRIGRAGHSIGEKSKGIIISTDPDDIFESMVIARRAMAGELEETISYNYCLDVLANQIIGFLMEDYEMEHDEMYERIKKAYPYHNLKREDFDWVVQYLARLWLIWNNEDMIRRSKKAMEYYFTNLSTIPSIFQYQVINNVENTNVGVLDEAFVAEHAEPGATIIISGRPWRIISSYEGKVFVEPAGSLDSSVPAWEGELIPVPYETAQEVGRIRRNIADWIIEKKKDKEIVALIQKEYKIDGEASKKIIDYVKKQVKAGAPIPDDTKFLIESGPEFVVIHSCFGSMVNQTLSRYLGVLLSAHLGRSVAIKQDPYRIIIQGANEELIKKLIDEIDPPEIEDVIRRTIDYTQMFRWRMIHVAKRFGAIRKDAKWDKINLKKLAENFENTPVYEETMRDVLLEKLDVDKTAEIFKRVKKNEIIVEMFDEISPIGQSGIEYQFKELIGPKRPEGEIFDIFKERLLNTRMKMICMKCGDYSVTKSVRDIKEDPQCPLCNSRQVAAIDSRRRPEELLKKHFKDKSLTKEEEKEIEKILHTGDLVLTYGRKVIVALAGKGVGPDTAIRILAKQNEDDEFYKAILEAERNFTKHKKYWS